MRVIESNFGQKTLEYPLNVSVCRLEEVYELCLLSEGTNFPDCLHVVSMPIVWILSI